MEGDYLSSLDAAVISVLGETDDFYDLVTKCVGIHPIELVSSLDRIHKNGILDDRIFKHLVVSASANLRQRDSDNYKRVLPIPHQVDFDWRFSKNGKEYFINRIDNLITNGSIKRIAFIGSPSLFRHYYENQNKSAEFFLIDFNANIHIDKSTLPSNAHIVNCNLNYDLDFELKVDQIRADLIVMDPPWYPEYYKKFFEISDVIGAAKCLIYGVFPPNFTRESIPTERYDINVYIRNLGFEELQFEPFCIEYYTPPFEQNVLKANDITNYPMCWRKGDFFTTHRNNKTATSSDNTEIIIRNGGWTEKSIGNVRFKLRQGTFSEDMEFNIRLDSLYDDDIYPSVSRRFKGHEKINVWTSGNRVFYCSNIPILFMILEHINDNDIVSTFEDEYGEIIADMQRYQIKKVQSVMYSVINLELKEYGEWVK